MNEIFSRTKILIGTENLLKLQSSNVIIFGIGGVGSYCAEALARAGITNITLVDNDIISLSNINRQIIALHSTVGKSKVEVMKRRILDINPDCNVVVHQIFLNSENICDFDFTAFDYVVDAIDTITSKLLIISAAKAVNTNVISCMGAGNRLTSDFIVDDIYNTSICPLARVMRRELKARNINSCNVIYSKSNAQKPLINIESEFKRCVPGSISYVPSTAGLLAAEQVVAYLISL